MWEFLSQNLRNKIFVTRSPRHKISVTDFFSRIWGMRETNTNSKLEKTYVVENQVKIKIDIVFFASTRYTVKVNGFVMGHLSGPGMAGLGRSEICDGRVGPGRVLRKCDGPGRAGPRLLKY